METGKSLRDAPKYRAWRRKLDENGLIVQAVNERYVKQRDDGGLLYALVELEAESPDGQKLPPTCLVQGYAVSVLVVLIDAQTSDKYVLLVRQRRICDGSETYEHPAGMIDDEEAPADVAARELGEETGLAVTPDELVRVSPKPWFSASSVSDEALYFFYLERRLPLADIQELHGRRTGKAEEQEHTTLHIASLPDAHQLVSNMHGVLGHLLYLNEVGDYETMKRLKIS